MDLAQLHDDVTMNEFIESTGYMELPSEEDATYVHLKADDLAVISRLDDDLPDSDDLSSSE